MIPLEILQGALATVAGLPLAAIAILTFGLALTQKLSETRVHQLVGGAMAASFVLATLLFLGLLTQAVEPFSVDLGRVISVRGYHFDLVLRLDVLGAMFLWLTVSLGGLVGAFSAPYLHQDEGFHRFYFLLLVFIFGLECVALGEGLDLVFVGWELLGLSSALLIAFFQRRKAPVENGLRAYAFYRMSDLALLLGIVFLHHLTDSTSLGSLSTVPSSAVLALGALLIFGAMAKGGIFPLTSWLPRAMEGPTPSSAIFYGALSIHASPFLLLRISPLLEQRMALQLAVIGLGVITAIHASMVGRTQTDIKTSLGYASVAQVGVIWIWVGLGWYELAAIHTFSHAILRTWQLLRAPSLLHERHELVSSLGRSLRPTGQHLERLLPLSFRRWSYRIALERWYLDELWDAAAQGALVVLGALDRLDRAWSGLLDSPAKHHKNEVRER